MKQTLLAAFAAVALLLAARFQRFDAAQAAMGIHYLNGGLLFDGEDWDPTVSCAHA